MIVTISFSSFFSAYMRGVGSGISNWADIQVTTTVLAFSGFGHLFWLECIGILFDCVQLGEERIGAMYLFGVLHLLDHATRVNVLVLRMKGKGLRNKRRHGGKSKHALIIL